MYGQTVRSVSFHMTVSDGRVSGIVTVCGTGRIQALHRVQFCAGSRLGRQSRHVASQHVGFVCSERLFHWDCVAMRCHS